MLNLLEVNFHKIDYKNIWMIFILIFWMKNIYSFDINKTILIEDKAGNKTKEDCIA